MATCQCGVELTGRRRKCDACKGRSTVARELAERGAEAPPAAAEVVVDSTPPGLHDRGRALWSALGQELATPAGQVALEACRAADRLDELDSIIAGKGVLNLLAFRTHLDIEDMLLDGQHLKITVGFQNVLAEARQQQAGFKALLAEISAVVPAPAPKPADVPTGPAKSALDELEERRAQKAAGK